MLTRRLICMWYAGPSGLEAALAPAAEVRHVMPSARVIELQEQIRLLEAELIDSEHTHELR